VAASHCGSSERARKGYFGALGYTVYLPALHIQPAAFSR